MADPRVLAYLKDFLDRDVIPLLAAPPGMALGDYRDAVLTRFSNPAVNDQLLRITSDGGSKIPVFLGDTIQACLEGGGDHRRLAFLLAAFARYLAGIDDQGARFEPQEPHLTAADRALATDPDPTAPLRLSTFKGLGLEGASTFVASFKHYRAQIADQGTLATLEAMNREG
jgi:mannitol-1-phosphate/altronate dehydrogenase